MGEPNYDTHWKHHRHTHRMRSHKQFELCGLDPEIQVHINSIAIPFNQI